MASHIIDVSRHFQFDRAQLSQPVLGEARNLAERVRETNERIPDGWPVGYERDLGRHLVPKRLGKTSDYDLGQIIPGFLTRSEKGLDKIDARPETELCLHALWTRPGAPPKELKRPDLDFLAGRIGTTLRWREMRTAQTPSGHRILFTAVPDIERRLDAFLNHFNTPIAPRDALLGAVDSYLHFLLIHPFRDGNGFAARALFQLFLNRHLGLRAPIFPIAPIYYRNLDLFQYGYLSWTLRADGDPLLGLFARVIDSLDTFFLDEVAHDPV
ncbi:MAG: Fic family protein [Pseudomonadota bacterium]